MAWDSEFEPFQLQEVDVTKVPPELLDGLKKSTAVSALETETLQKPGSEVWILQCPKDVKLTPLLEGKKLRLDSSNSTILFSDEDGKKYESTCFPQTGDSSESIATMLPNETGDVNLISVPLAGRILIREAHEELPCPSFAPLAKDIQKHKLPTGIKERHPIYGVNFSKALESMENEVGSDTVPKLKRKKSSVHSSTDVFNAKINGNTADISLSYSKKNKDKSKRQSTSGQQDIGLPSPAAIQNSRINTTPATPESFSNKKRKVKTEVVVPSSDYETEADQMDHQNQIHKKKHKKHGKADVEEVSYFTEVPVSDSPRKKKKSKPEVAVDYDQALEFHNNEWANEIKIEEASPKKKKHKKSKTRTNYDDEAVIFVPQHLETELSSTKKKKHKKSKIVDSDTHLDNFNGESAFKMEVEDVEETPKKKKHKKSKTQNNFDDPFLEYSNNDWSTANTDESLPKKKKKHK